MCIYYTFQSTRDLQYQYKITHTYGWIQRSEVQIKFSFTHEKQVTMYQRQSKRKCTEY